MPAGWLRIHEVEADAVGAVAAGTAGVTAIGHCRESDLHAPLGRERRIQGQDDGAILAVAARGTVREPQSAIADRIRESAGRTADERLTIVRGARRIWARSPCRHQP